MKAPIRKLASFAAISMALFASGYAQLETFETVSTWAGSAITFGGAGSKKAQTFSGLIAVSQITYTFASTNPAASGASFNAVFGEWNGSTGGSMNIVGPAVQDFGLITIPAVNTWTTQVQALNGPATVFNYAFNFGNGMVELDGDKTYVLMLTASSGTSFGLGQVDSDDLVSPLTDSFTLGGQVGAPGKDWAFAAIKVVPVGNDIPVIPETSTVAALLGGGLAVGLFVLRLRQRRQQAVLVAA